MSRYIRLIPKTQRSSPPDWASPLADKARELTYWYFAEVTKLKADVGVSEVEKKAASAREYV